MCVLACGEHLRVPRHAAPLTRPPNELSIDILGARIASNSVHIYNLSINTLGANTTSNSVHIDNPNFPLGVHKLRVRIEPFRTSINQLCQLVEERRVSAVMVVRRCLVQLFHANTKLQYAANQRASVCVHLLVALHQVAPEFLPCQMTRLHVVWVVGAHMRVVHVCAPRVKLKPC
jgi:hypothetical protein